MKIGQELYAVVDQNGEIFNCWTSPNRLYETKGPATRIINTLIRDAEHVLKHGDKYDRPKDIKSKAKARRARLEELKLLTVKKVVVVVKPELQQT